MVQTDRLRGACQANPRSHQTSKAPFVLPMDSTQQLVIEPYC
jgi:hypothetical protein